MVCMLSVISRGMPDIKWMNLDPLKLMEELSQFTSLEGFKEMLDKAQVGHAYMDRPCLEPNDPDCPLSAPNKDLRQVGMDHLWWIPCYPECHVDFKCFI